MSDEAMIVLLSFVNSQHKQLDGKVQVFLVFALKYSHEQISKEMTDAATKKKPAQGMFAVGSTDNEYFDNI